MELKQLQYFVVSVDMGSFQNAAKMLYTTQPHVSKTVKALEDELGLKLLNREARGVKVTSEGKRVYDYASVILKNTDLISRINEDNQANRLAVATMPGARVAQLCAKYYGTQKDKGLQFGLKQGSMEEIMGYLHKHVVEFGFVYVSNTQMSALYQTLEYKRLEFVPLKKIRMSLMVGKNHPLFDMETINEAELKALSYVQYDEEYFSLIHHLGHLNESLHRFGKIDNVVTTNSDSALFQMVVYGNMCHLGCADIEEEEEQRDLVHHIQLENTESDVFFGYIKRQRSTLSPICESLIEYVMQHLQA